MRSSSNNARLAQTEKRNNRGSEPRGSTITAPPQPNAKPMMLEVARPKYSLSPKFRSMGIGDSIFKKGLMNEKPNLGFQQLLKKIQDSSLTLRQIKNGQSIFQKDVMQKDSVSLSRR